VPDYDWLEEMRTGPDHVHWWYVPTGEVKSYDTEKCWICGITVQESIDRQPDEE